MKKRTWIERIVWYYLRLKQQLILGWKWNGCKWYEDMSNDWIHGHFSYCHTTWVKFSFKTCTLLRLTCFTNQQNDYWHHLDTSCWHRICLSNFGHWNSSRNCRGNHTLCHILWSFGARKARTNRNDWFIRLSLDSLRIWADGWSWGCRYFEQLNFQKEEVIDN